MKYGSSRSPEYAPSRQLQTILVFNKNRVLASTNIPSDISFADYGGCL